MTELREPIRWRLFSPAYREAMRIEQNFTCALCHEHLYLGGSCVDHDHATGMVRALIHWSCNLRIGCAERGEREAGEDERAYIQKYGGTLPDTVSRLKRIALPPDLLQFASDLGDGNISEGVRRALVFTREAVEMDLRVALDRAKESE